MTKENQDDSFVILQEGEITQLRHEALNHIRFGNDSLDNQFKRDIEFMSLAIVDYGLSEQDKLKADRLLKSMLLLFFGQVCYRHSSDQCFYPFDTLNNYFKTNTTLTHFPIAAILLHGSRVLIEFPSELARQIMDWLIIDKNSWRYAATHGISVLTEAERIDNNDNTTNPFIYKCLKEEKINIGQATINFAYNSVTGLMTSCSEFMQEHTSNKLDIAEHYGFDLALGGVGNQHFASKKMIQNNGEHGHLYINFYQGETQKSSGLLLGIEQSAPGKPDQYGGEHDLRVSDKCYSASGGDFFGKKPPLPEIYQKDYRGLSVLPFTYYDSLWNFITEETFNLIKTNFEKCKCLLSLLSRKKILAFIKHILNSSGGAKQQDFDQLFDHYFQEIPQYKVRMNQKINAIEGLETYHEQLALSHEKQQAEDKTITRLHHLEEQIQSLIYEKKTIKQASEKELTQLQQQFVDIQKEKNMLLFNLAKCFMQTVIRHMGWRANKSQKQTIMLSLQQLNAKERQLEISSDHIKNLLKNFIAVSLMNPYGLNNGQTRSARACLNYLNLPEYHPLKTLLFLNTNKMDYDDLLRLIVGAEVKNKPIFISARYKKNLYRFYQEEGNRENQFDENKLMLATQQIMYTL